jgi:hypothetical protein
MPKPKFKLDTSIRKEYLYLIHPRNLEKNDVCIYKIGRTYDLENRLNVYPSNSVVYRVTRVINCYYAETRLISTFHKNFTHRKDIGKEYFEGDLSDMVECMQILIDAIGQEIADDDVINDVKAYYGDMHGIYVDGQISDNVLDRHKGIKTNAKYQCGK